MAKQIGDIILAGTIDDITFYKMEGKGYARKKTSLTGKRVKRDPRFKRTMQSANRFGRGNQLASKVYRSLPRPKQVYALFKELKRIAILALKEGNSEAEVAEQLQQRVVGSTTPVPCAAPSPKTRWAGLNRPAYVKKLFGARGRKRPKRVRTERKPLAVQRE